jgi:23S rRNA (guanine745-N1)-methyltransferase
VLAAVLRHLRCPVCHEHLAAAAGALRCPRGHGFDEARQGYVSLLAGPVSHSGDSAPMVAARAAFLAAGHYDFISAALVEQSVPGAFVVDAGAGTGYHLARVLDALPAAVGLALEVSTPALRRAARAHPRAGAVRCDTWRALPVADRTADLLLNVFAPRNGAEFARVLRPGGRLLVVTPTAAHLGELIGPLRLLRVDQSKVERVGASLTPWFQPESATVHTATLALPRAEVATLVGMGPSAWHTAPEELRHRLAALAEPVRVTAQVRVAAYRRP